MSHRDERRTVVLVPGLLCDASVWVPQRHSLERDYDVLVPDLWGLDSIEAMAGAILDMAPERFALAGHSMGARVALAILDRAPERVERLALLDTGVHPRRPGEAAKRQELVDLAHAQGMAALAERWLPPMVHPQRAGDPALMRQLAEMVCRATPEIFGKQVRALLNRPDAAAVLPRIDCPTLVACGRQDGWSPLSQHEEMAAAIRDAELAVIEDSGHMSTVEAPAAVTGVLSAWLRLGVMA